MVHGDVRTDDLRWTFQAPCLLVVEANELGHWLRHTRDPDAGRGPLGFIEPCLSLDVVERGVAHVHLRIVLDHDAAPPGPDWSPPEPVALDLRLPVDELIAASDAWLESLAHFPER